MTEIEAKRATLVASLEDYHGELIREAEATRMAINALTGTPPTPAKAEPKTERQWKPRKPKAKRAWSKKRKATVKAPNASTTKRAAPKPIDEPTTRKGRLPASVQVKTADDPAERKAMVDDLVAKGYERAAIGHRLAPGLFDVNHRADGVLVTWWPTEGEARRRRRCVSLSRWSRRSSSRTCSRSAE